MQKTALVALLIACSVCCAPLAIEITNDFEDIRATPPEPNDENTPDPEKNTMPENDTTTEPTVVQPTAEEEQTPQEPETTTDDVQPSSYVPGSINIYTVSHETTAVVTPDEPQEP